MAGRVLTRGVTGIEFRSPTGGHIIRVPVRHDGLFGIVITGWEQFFPDGRECRR